MVASAGEDVTRVKAGEGQQGSPSSPMNEEDKAKEAGPSPCMNAASNSGSSMPPYPPPPPHPMAIHYYHPYPPPTFPLGYDHSRSKAKVEDPSAVAPPPGPYTAAQHEMRKSPPGPPIPVPRYAGPPTPPSVAGSSGLKGTKRNGNNRGVGSSQSGTSLHFSSSTNEGVTKSPQPPHHTHTYHHPAPPPGGDHGGMAPPAPPRRHHGPVPPPHHHHPHHPGYPPFVGPGAAGAASEEHHMGPHPTQPLPRPHHHRTRWGDYYYHDQVGSHAYPPLPPPHSRHYQSKSDGKEGKSLVQPNPGQPTVGPYRFSDTTLRREALSHLRAKRMANVAAGAATSSSSDLDDRDGATSPSQIETSHREEVSTMGCTCKKTKCLKLYCQCFAVKIYCSGSCRCMVCQNTATHERERQDAIRSILSRNPQAFDTKFKKSVPDKAAPELAHKLGCKCRKSACMKKYCECYAGNVRCSDNCRCVGCKNVGPRPGPLPPPPPAPLMAPISSQHGPGTLVAAIAAGEDPRKREPYMMNAAHNLAFMKHASPAAHKTTNEPRRTPSQDGESSMPSLASEESPVESSASTTRPAAGENRPSTSAATEAPTTDEKTAVNALLMAAVAMTEMSSAQSEDAATNQPEGTPPVSSATRNSINDTTPPYSRSNDQSMDHGEYETPQKNLLKQFQSPKRMKADSSSTSPGSQQECFVGKMRRSGESGSGTSPDAPACDDNDDDSPKRELSEMSDLTPSVQQKSKKSRIGSVRKGSRVLDMAPQPSPMALETPKHATRGAGGNPATTSDLTPVSARCIDFKRMHVHEVKEAPNTTSPEAAAATAESGGNDGDGFASSSKLNNMPVVSTTNH